MIALEKYETQIGKHDLYDLLFGERYDMDGDTEPTQSELETALEQPEKQSQSIIKQRFGGTPSDSDFLDTATVAGVIYLLSRKPKNQVGQEEIDLRRQTFFDMLPADPGSESRAEVKSNASRLGNWL